MPVKKYTGAEIDAMSTDDVLKLADEVSCHCEEEGEPVFFGKVVQCSKCRGMIGYM